MIWTVRITGEWQAVRKDFNPDGTSVEWFHNKLTVRRLTKHVNSMEPRTLFLRRALTLFVFVLLTAAMDDVIWDQSSLGEDVNLLLSEMF